MSKKIMLLALTVVSAALFALPAMASAQEIHIEGAAGKTFTGTGPAGSLSAAGEPAINCGGTTAHGSFDASSETTGSVELKFETCSATILGVSLHCRTAADGTGVIRITQVFHLITISANKPGILVTPPFPEIICGESPFVRNIKVGGTGVIGTITSPACGASSASLTVNYSAPGGTQEHESYTGNPFDLTSQTLPSGSPVTAGLNSHATLTFSDGVSRKLVCT